MALFQLLEKLHVDPNETFYSIRKIKESKVTKYKENILKINIYEILYKTPSPPPNINT